MKDNIFQFFTQEVNLVVDIWIDFHFIWNYMKKGLRLSSKPLNIDGSGGWIRTNDLRVMSPTSYQTAPPRETFYKIATDN